MTAMTKANDIRNAAHMAQLIADTPKKRGRDGNVTMTVKQGELNLIHYLLTSLGAGSYDEVQS